MKKQINMIIIALILFLIGVVIVFWSENQFLIYLAIVIIVFSFLETLGNFIGIFIKNPKYNPIISIITGIIGLFILIGSNYYLKVSMPEVFNLTYTRITIIGYLIFIIIIISFIFYQKKQNILVDNKNLNIRGIGKLVDEQQSDKVEQMPIDERKKYLEEYSAKLALNPKYRSKLARKLTKDEIEKNSIDQD